MTTIKPKRSPGRPRGRRNPIAIPNNGKYNRLIFSLTKNPELEAALIAGAIRLGKTPGQYARAVLVEALLGHPPEPEPEPQPQHKGNHPNARVRGWANTLSEEK